MHRNVFSGIHGYRLVNCGLRILFHRCHHRQYQDRDFHFHTSWFSVWQLLTLSQVHVVVIRSQRNISASSIQFSPDPAAVLCQFARLFQFDLEIGIH